MKWQAKHPQLGSEYDWFAVDADEHIGFISTAGFGPLPSWLASDVAQQEMLDVREAMLKLVGRRGAANVRPERYNVNDWIEFAERGLFAYDWNHMKDLYDIVVLPSVPIRLEEIADTRLRETLS